MRKIHADIAIIGAGPAGLSAAVQAAKAGADVVVIDENKLPGGQLFKQIHKFFGSREHLAGVRGFDIGTKLLDEVERAGVRVMLDTLVFGLFDDGRCLGLIEGGARACRLEAQRVILATGGQENYIAFPGSTLPGVMGAGAAQTMIHVNRVLPGERVVMLGSGNVGLIVSYQLMQAGAEVAALVEAAPTVGGYGVHACKISRAGVPILTAHTVTEAYGADALEGVTVAQVDARSCPIPGTERHIPCDTLCLAVGLNPMTELAWMAGCRFEYIGPFGGHIPVHDRDMRTSVEHIYVAGDVCGVEEASTAMEEGKLAGIAAAESLGCLDPGTARGRKEQVWRTLDTLRSGYFGQKRAEMKEKILASFSVPDREA